jgi:hypothetical protein
MHFRLHHIFDRKKGQNQGIKGETRKIYRALREFYKSTVIPMVRWSFERADFRLNSDNLLRPLTVDPTPVLERPDVPELPLNDAFVYPEQSDPYRLQQARQRRRQ